MKRTRSIRTILLGIGIILSAPASAAVIADWGVIPIGSETSFIFTPSDATTNFSDQYRFSLVGSTAISYSTSSFLALCTRGCGSPALEFGIYDASGGLLDASGSIMLGAGNYAFQIRGTGMGSGNTAGTGGVINFYSQATELVSPTPEPATWLLMVSGLALLGLRMRRRGRILPQSAARAAGEITCHG
jgi:hypothetical protein